MNRLAVIFMVFLLSACAPKVEADASGEEIYNQLCARCHSQDLSGGIGPAIGAGTDSAENPDAFIETAVTRGRGRMPSFGRSLDGDQVERLIEYVRVSQVSR